MTTTRRSALAGLAALSSLALAGAAQAKSKAFEAGKLFPYLDMYLGLPAAQRSRFEMIYAVSLIGAPIGALKVVLLGPGGARTPIPLAGDGRVLRLPTLAELKGKAQVELTAPDGAKLKLTMQMGAKVARAATLSAAELNAAIAQCDAAIKSKAGVLGFAAPKVKRVELRGAGSGQAIDAKGVAKPLPVVKGQPQFDPEQMPGTVSLKLARAPSGIYIVGRPKK